MGKPWMSCLNPIMLPGVTSALTIHLFEYFSLSKHEINENQSQKSQWSASMSPLQAQFRFCVCDGSGQGYLIVWFMECLGLQHRARDSAFPLWLGIPLLLTVVVLSSCGCCGYMNCLAAGEAIPVLFLSPGISKGFSFPVAPQVQGVRILSLSFFIFLGCLDT